MKKLIVSVFGVVLISAMSVSSASAYVRDWAWISTAFGGTPNPIQVGKPAETMVEVTNVDAYMNVQGMEIHFSPPQDSAYHMLDYSVTLDGQVVCDEYVEICEVGVVRPGQAVLLKVRFHVQRPGEYEDFFAVVHDGIHTSFGGLTTAVRGNPNK